MAIAKKVYAEIKGNPSVDLSNALVTQYFDTRSMAIHAIGRPFQGLSNDLKNSYVQAFENYFKRTLYEFLTTNRDATISGLSSRVNGGLATARCTLTLVSGQTVDLSFSLFLDRGSWRANDVFVDNISLILAYKPQFSSVYKQRGFDGLIEYLNGR